MLEIKKTDVIRDAIATYGNAAQVDMAIEEMSELTKALCKERRTDRLGASLPEHKAALENVIEEIADVLIMAKQLLIIFDCEAEVEREIEHKLNRLEKRLERNTK